MPLSMSSPSISTQPIGRRPRPDNERTTRQSTFPVEWDPPMSTRAPHRAVEACPRRASPHCPKHPHARTTPALSRPASALSSDGRSTPRPGRCGRRCRRPETPRIPSARIIVAGEGNPRPKRVWGAGIFAGKPAAILSPAARRARVNHQSNSPLAARPPRHADADTRSPPPPLPI